MNLHALAHEYDYRDYELFFKQKNIRSRLLLFLLDSAETRLLLNE